MIMLTISILHKIARIVRFIPSEGNTYMKQARSLYMLIFILMLLLFIAYRGYRIVVGP